MDKELQERGESLRRAVIFGVENGKKNMIVEMSLLDEIFRGNIPVGGNEKPPEEVNALMYEMKSQRDKLLHAGRKVLAGLNDRLDAALAEGGPVPVFNGISELHTAIQAVVARN